MGRYEKKDTTTLIDILLPPTTYSSEITDTKTGEKGKGAGFTRQEAKNNAWGSLKSKNRDC